MSFRNKFILELPASSASSSILSSSSLERITFFYEDSRVVQTTTYSIFVWKTLKAKVSDWRPPIRFRWCWDCSCLRLAQVAWKYQANSVSTAYRQLAQICLVWSVHSSNSRRLEWNSSVVTSHWTWAPEPPLVLCSVPCSWKPVSLLTFSCMLMQVELGSILEQTMFMRARKHCSWLSGHLFIFDGL